MKTNVKLLMTAAALALCAGAASAQSVVKIGINDDPDTLDPALSPAFSTRVVLTTVCDKLFDITAEQEIVPQLVDTYEWSDDGTVLTLTLKPDLLFQDGEPLDAEALKYNLERSINLEGSLRKAELEGISDIEVVDNVTVKLNLDAPLPPLVSILADRSGIMLSPKQAEALGADFGSEPVCAGPFKFVSRVPQGRIIFEKFADYWDVDNIHFDRVEFLAVNDTTVRLSNLESGEFDIIERVSPTDVEQIKASDDLKLYTASEIGFGYVQFNVGNGEMGEKFKDVRLRQAVDSAIDYQALVDVAFDGLYEPGQQFIAPGSFYHDETREPKTRDIEKSKELLKEAGQENFSFTMLVRPDRDYQVPAQVMQSMLAEAGITMEIATTENVTQLQMARAGNFEAYMSFWSGRLDPDGNTFRFFTCGSAGNYMGYCNEEVDEYLTKARTVVDPAARKEFYKQALDIVYEEAPELSMWHRTLLAASRADIEGFELFSDGMVRLQGVSRN